MRSVLVRGSIAKPIEFNDKERKALLAVTFTSSDSVD